MKRIASANYVVVVSQPYSNRWKLWIAIFFEKEGAQARGVKIKKYLTPEAESLTTLNLHAHDFFIAIDEFVADFEHHIEGDFSFFHF